MGHYALVVTRYRLTVWTLLQDFTCQQDARMGWRLLPGSVGRGPPWGRRRPGRYSWPCIQSSSAAWLLARKDPRSCVGTLGPGLTGPFVGRGAGTITSRTQPDAVCNLTRRFR